jgi:hypothetical protein
LLESTEAPRRGQAGRDRDAEERYGKTPISSGRPVRLGRISQASKRRGATVAPAHIGRDELEPWPVAAGNELTYPAAAELLSGWGVTLDLVEFEVGVTGASGSRADGGVFFVGIQTRSDASQAVV